MTSGRDCYNNGHQWPSHHVMFGCGLPEPLPEFSMLGCLYVMWLTNHVTLTCNLIGYFNNRDLPDLITQYNERNVLIITSIMYSRPCWPISNLIYIYEPKFLNISHSHMISMTTAFACQFSNSWWWFCNVVAYIILPWSCSRQLLLA